MWQGDEEHSSLARERYGTRGGEYNLQIIFCFET